MNVPRITYSFATILLLLIALRPVTADSTFPLREKFPDVPVISLSELEQQHDDVVIIDTRTRFEYEMIHINKAFRVPASSKSFLKLLERHVPDQESTQVFYCNGITCSKNYRAARMASEADYRNVYSFDAGISVWANANPDLTTLRGKTPLQVVAPGIRRAYQTSSDPLQPVQDTGQST